MEKSVLTLDSLVVEIERLREENARLRESALPDVVPEDVDQLRRELAEAHARVEELEREKQGEYLCGNCGELMVRCMGPLTERAEAVEAKLARCVEALEEGLLLTASWADVRTHNWRNEVRAALAAAKGGVR